MAKGRFLSRSISTNEQLAAVSLEAAFLFSWSIPHLDVEGRMAGSPMFVKANVVPLRDEITIKRIPRLLEELGGAVDPAGVSLIVWYEAGRQQVVLFPRFGQQQILRRNRESESQLPALTEHSRILAGALPDLLRENGGSTPGGTPGSTPGEVPASLSLSLSLTPCSPSDFAAAWERYPRRAGSNTRKDAESAWNARLREGVTAEALSGGVERYRAWCDATGKTGTEFVMQGRRFFGPSQAFAEDWSISQAPTPQDVALEARVRSALAEQDALDAAGAKLIAERGNGAES